MCLTAIGWPGVTIKVDTVYKGCPITFFDNLYLSCTYNFPLQHTVLELHYDQLGKHTTFTLWIAGFLIESLGDNQVEFTLLSSAYYLVQVYDSCSIWSFWTQLRLGCRSSMATKEDGIQASSRLSKDVWDTLYITQAS